MADGFNRPPCFIPEKDGDRIWTFFPYIQNIEKFIQKSSQYAGIEELTPYVLHELVKAIYVDAPDKSSGKRRQHIHIQYDGLGFIPLNELLTSEKA